MASSRKRKRATKAKDSKDDIDITPDNDFCFSTGDVRILVKHEGEDIEGRVSSSALSLASPVWEKFLFPPWEAEEPADGVEEIDCTGDDSGALLILLSVAHLKFQNVPSFLPYKTLLQVAVLCDQYDCVTLVRPWLSTSLWLAGEEQEALASGQRRWLFIAWVFGRESVFEKLAIHIVKNIGVTDEQRWKDMAPMPDGIIEYPVVS
ncbi:hypothetical protein BDZ45DRAFT_249219 [Acephala macrosclerotiorum]|nr:hypothetical protein BDZ45DRAFT_249219 [Acephala macrosclerotiorum]